MLPQVLQPPQWQHRSNCSNALQSKEQMILTVQLRHVLMYNQHHARQVNKGPIHTPSDLEKIPPFLTWFLSPTQPHRRAIHRVTIQSRPLAALVRVTTRKYPLDRVLRGGEARAGAPKLPTLQAVLPAGSL